MTDPAAPSLQPSPTRPAISSFLTAGGVVLAIGGLYFGRDIFIPFALAILLSFVLTPLVNRLQQLKLPKIAAILVAVALAFAVIGALAVVVGTQLVQLADNLPQYQQTITQKIHSLRASSANGGVVDKVTTTLDSIGEELTSPKEPAGAARPGTANKPKRDPVSVIIETPGAQPLEVIRTVVGPLLAPLATAGVVVVFVIFMLIEREDLRDRFIKLVGGGDLQRTTTALNEAGHRVSRYLLMQLMVNVTYGIPIGVGLYFIGVPNAVLWGMLAIVLRFVPYLGPFLAAMFPLALAFAVDPGWSMLIWTIALILSIELISNNVVEPWLYGSSTGLSSFAIIIAAVFWTTLWGSVGLFLSTPLTVCLVVIGRYVPQLEFLGVLLGSDPVLAPEERFYQRLLAANVEEAVEIAETYVNEKSSQQFYDEVAIPALRLAENDRQRSTSEIGYRRVVADGATAVVREVAEHVSETETTTGEGIAGHDLAQPVVGRRVLCIGGRTELDRAASEMVAEVLGERGIAAQVLPPIAVSQDAIGQLDLSGVEVVCLSYFHPQLQVFARYVGRRLKRRAPNLRIIVCVWNPQPEAVQAGDLPAQMGADAVALSLATAADQMAVWLQSAASTTASPMLEPAIPENEQERLNALRELGLTSARGEHFDALARRVAEAFDMPIALVSLIDETNQLWPGAAGLPPDLDTSRQAARNTSICGHVVADGEMVVVEDIAKDERFTSNPFLLEKGIRFYAGAPLRTSSGFVLGSLCVIDVKPRSFGPKDRKLLQLIADELMSEVEVGHRYAPAPVKEGAHSGLSQI